MELNVKRFLLLLLFQLIPAFSHSTTHNSLSTEFLLKLVSKYKM